MVVVSRATKFTVYVGLQTPRRMIMSITVPIMSRGAGLRTSCADQMP